MRGTLGTDKVMDIISLRLFPFGGHVYLVIVCIIRCFYLGADSVTYTFAEITASKNFNARGFPGGSPGSILVSTGNQQSASFACW
jgi:hypothetical protein